MENIGDALTCYVCGGDAHADRTAVGGHKFWSITDARQEFTAEPVSNYDAAAAYVDEYIGR